MNEKDFDKIINALKIKALGNVITITTEEYKEESGQKELKNKTIKKIQNDIDTQACIKLIDLELKRREIERENNPYDNLSDKELEQEKKRLFKELKRMIDNGEI